MSGEKKRLEQFLLQRGASNIMMIDPRFGRFQPANIDRMRLLSQQRLAGQVPISERLKKEQKKKKRKARRTKNLRGDVAQNIREQRRFAKGERRDKDTEEPLIVGDPKPVPVGSAYDPEIERRRLDLEAGRDRQRQAERLQDRRDRQQREGDDLAFRRLELQARQADRLALAGLPAAFAAALPAPAPVVIPLPEPLPTPMFVPPVVTAPNANCPTAVL